MKLAFMTWVCPEWTVDEIIAGAQKYGYEGVEIRVQCSQKHGIDLDTDEAALAAAVRKFADGGIALPCIATSSRFSAAEPEERRKMIEETKAYVELAERLGTPYIRVFGGPIPAGVEKETCKRYVAECLHELGEFAAGHNVVLGLETHDSFSLAKDATETIRMADHPNIRCLWDFAHPCRAGESVDEAFGYVKDLVVHTHIHDLTIAADGKTELVPMGTGDVPHAEAVRHLASINFDGYLSGEWINWKAPDEVLGYEAQKLREYIAAT